MKFTMKNIFAIAQAVLALVAIFVMFAPAVIITTDLILTTAQTELTGFQAWLGATIESNEYFTLQIDASFGGVFTLIVLILLVLAPVAKIFVKDAKIKMIVNVAICVLAIVAAIFLFCGTTQLMVNTDEALKGASLGAGAIVPAIVMILVGASAAVEQFVLKD